MLFACCEKRETRNQREAFKRRANMFCIGPVFEMSFGIFEIVR